MANEQQEEEEEENHRMWDVNLLGSSVGRPSELRSRLKMSHRQLVPH